MAETVVLIGSYTQPIVFGTGEVFQGHGKGIGVYTLKNGALHKRSEVQTVNASFLAMDPKRRFLFATNELKEFGGPGGAVSSYSYQNGDHALLPLTTKRVFGSDPCHVVTDPSGKFLLCANFMSGSVTVLPILPDGSLGDACCFIQHKGSSVDPKRQRGPHAHGVFFSPDGRFLYVPDLGMDCTLCYHLHLRTGQLCGIPENRLPALHPGEGPRHMVFHPSGGYCYLNTEMGSTVQTARYEASSGKLDVLQELSTIPAGTDPESTSTSAIKLHPDGKLLYVSNRGHDSLATYRVNPDTGMLALLSVQKTGGQIPRDFEISPCGRYLIAVHQSSNDAALFRIDRETGTLTEIGRTYVPSPICVRVYEFSE